jgi:DNA helicase-2/ATP-dependent DNA helicase PcrA
MRIEDIDLFSIKGGSITAPAGCGKTHLIADTLKRHKGKKPILVLTHTNAGVAALRTRLAKASVPSVAYSLATIDGWAMRLAAMFPKRSGLDHSVLKVEKPSSDYPAIRRSASAMLKAGHFNEIIGATFSYLVVDEYQDCSELQHEIVSGIADTLSTCVLGDPMQAIFGFKGNELVDWDTHVCKRFPRVTELDTPWRWNNAGASSLGEWLLSVRKDLIAKKAIDLKTVPREVTWIQLDGNDSDYEKSLKAAGTKATGKDDGVLIIGDSKNPDSRFKIASAVPGAVTVEAVELKDLVLFARDLDLNSKDALSQVVHFAQNTMTGVGAADLLKRVQSLVDGRARKAPSNVEKSAIAFVSAPSHGKVAELLEEIQQEGGVRVFRPAVLKACMRALQLCIGNPGVTFHDAAIRIREQNRAHGRSLPKRAVGSTLLLKGLEAEVAVILKACSLDARNLYVAMTRGSKGLVICSSTATLAPR